jgi:hypothetical protein
MESDRPPSPRAHLGIGTQKICRTRGTGGRTTTNPMTRKVPSVTHVAIGDGVVDKDTDNERQCPTCGGLGFVRDDDDDHEEVIKTLRL